MNENNKEALKSAHRMSMQVQKYLENGNMEMAHRATQVYSSIVLTVLVTELIPGVIELWDSLDEKPIVYPEDGTILQ